MNTASPSSDHLVAGIKTLQQEAQGVFGVDIIRPEEMFGLICVAAAGDPRAIALLNAATSTLERVRVSTTTREPMLCGVCPRGLGDGDFVIAIVSAAGATTGPALGLCICGHCARSVPDVTAKAAEALRRMWPDLRRIEISDAAGHA